MTKDPWGFTLAKDIRAEPFVPKLRQGSAMVPFKAWRLMFQEVVAQTAPPWDKNAEPLTAWRAMADQFPDYYLCEYELTGEKRLYANDLTDDWPGELVFAWHGRVTMPEVGQLIRLHFQDLQTLQIQPLRRWREYFKEETPKLTCPEARKVMPIEYANVEIGGEDANT